MESLARSILNGAQRVKDGGVAGDILRNVALINNSHVTEDVLARVTVRLREGYVAAVVAGGLWAAVMMVVMALLCLRERGRSGRPRESPRRGRKAAQTPCRARGGPLFVVVLVLLPSLVLLGLGLVNVALLTRALSSSSTTDSAALLPSVKASLAQLRLYLATFADKARLDTKLVVEEIVLATLAMQHETTARFNELLLDRLGVSETFLHGDEMTAIVVAFLELSSAFVQARDTHHDLATALFPPSLEPRAGLFRLVSLLRDSVSQLPSCDTGLCRLHKDFFYKDFTREDVFPDTDFASSFLFVMKQREETADSVKAKNAHGRRVMAASVARTTARMDVLVDIPGTVRNATSANWDKLDSQFAEAVAALDRVSLTLDKAASTVALVSSVFAVVMTLPLFLAFLVLSLAVVLVLDGGRSRNIRLAVYGSLTLLSISLFFATTTFIIGGNVETELCRYLRTEQPAASLEDSGSLVLDHDINKVLPDIIRSLPKSDSPTLTPHNVLHGLLHGCRRNEPIFVALDAVKSLDTRTLSKPEDSAKIVAIGRMVMVESLTETDPREMMPADMAESLDQAAQMDMFKEVDFEERLAKVPYSPLREIQGRSSRPVTIAEFKEHVEEYLDMFGSQIKDDSRRETLVQESRAVLSLLQRFTEVTEQTRVLLRQMKNTTKMEPVVQSLRKSLDGMLALMSDKTRLLTVANKYYDEVIVSSTPENTAKIMATYGPRIMSQLGLCRPLFEAYRSTVDTVCDVVVSKVNVSWLYLGAVVLLLTGALAYILIHVVRTSLFHGLSSVVHIVPPVSEDFV